MTSDATLREGFGVATQVPGGPLVHGTLEYAADGQIVSMSPGVETLLGPHPTLQSLVPEIRGALLVLPVRGASAISATVKRDGVARDLVFGQLRGVPGALVVERRFPGGHEGLDMQLRAIARALGDLGHQINNPLSGIVVALDIALDFETLAPETVELLNLARTEALRVAELVRCARDAAWAAPVDEDICDVNATIYEALGALRIELSRDRHTLDLGTLDGGGEFWADPVALKAILLNLVLNGRDGARNEGKRVSVRTHVEPSIPRALVIEVINDGRGMTPATVLRAGDSLFTTKRSGTGLGLTVVRRALTEIGGLLSLDTSPSDGTAARVVVPETQR